MSKTQEHFNLRPQDFGDGFVWGVSTAALPDMAGQLGLGDVSNAKYSDFNLPGYILNRDPRGEFPESEGDLLPNTDWSKFNPAPSSNVEDLRPPEIQAGYSYIPGTFGEIDPYNFSSAPYPAGGFGGGSPNEVLSNQPYIGGPEFMAGAEAPTTPGVQYGQPVPEGPGVSQQVFPQAPGEPPSVPMQGEEGVAAMPPDWAGATSYQGPKTDQIPFGTQGYFQSIFAPYYQALEGSPDAQTALTRMMQTEIGGQGPIAANMELGAAFSRMAAYDIPPTAQNIINAFTKGPGPPYGTGIGQDYPAGGIKYWQTPGRNPSQETSDWVTQAISDVLAGGRNLGYNPDVGPATGSGSYQYGAHPYDPLSGGKAYVSQADFPDTTLGTRGVEYFVQEGMPVLNNWIRTFNQIAPRYVPGSPL